MIRSERATASSHFKQAKQLADEDNDTIGSDAAKRWIPKGVQAMMRMYERLLSRLEHHPEPFRQWATMQLRGER